MKKIVQLVLTMLLTSCGNQTSNIEVKDPTIKINKEEVKYTLLDDTHLDEKDANDEILIQKMSYQMIRH
jgi:hypothetical protein